MKPETLVIAGGVFCIGFFVFHALFWRLFGWREDLRSLTYINRQVMQILNLCLMAAFAIFAYVSLLHTAELLQTPLGRNLLLLVGVFWWLRAIEQILFFGLSRLVSVGFFTVFVIGGLLYALPWYIVTGT